MKPDWKEAPEWAEWFFWDSIAESWTYCSKRPSFSWIMWSVRPRGGYAYAIGPRWAGNGRDSITRRPQTTTPQPEGQGDEGKRS